MGKKKKKIPPQPQLGPEAVLFDSHCHLDMGEPDDCGNLIQRAAAAGVAGILTIGIDLASSRRALEIADQYDNVYCAIGIHPHNTNDVSDSDYLELIALRNHRKVIAYGEIGLDFAKEYAPRDVQRHHFIRQLRLAKELQLPVIIHDRDAHDEMLAILRQEKPFPAGGVMHCFSGDSHYAAQIIELDFYISIPGVVTFANAGMLHEAVRNLPLHRMLVETDGPFLAPVPYRGKPNEPLYLLYTAAKVAEIKGMTLDQVARQTTGNCQKLFNLQGMV